MVCTAEIVCVLMDFRGQVVADGAMRLHAAYAVAYPSWILRIGTLRAFWTWDIFLLTLIIKDHVEATYIYPNNKWMSSYFIQILKGGHKGLSLLSDWWKYRTEKLDLPPHRLVSELSHPVELLLHFVCCCVNTYVGKYSASFLSIHRSVFHRGAAQNPICRIFSPSLQAADAEILLHDYIFAN